MTSTDRTAPAPGDITALAAREGGPVIATIVVIFAIIEERLQVLLVHRSGPPQQDSWALPGGRWRGTESLDATAARKLVEETGVEDVYLEQLFTTSGLDPERPSVAVAYFALVEASEVRLRDEESWRPGWFPVDDLPELAFDNNLVIDQARRRVGAKLDYTNIAYGLMPELFTIRELQRTYEAILDRPLDRRNFRKRMLSAAIIEPTSEHRREGAHRPAQLFRFRSREPVIL